MINEGWGFCCILGFWGWVLCTVAFITKSFPARGVFLARPAMAFGGAILVFYCLWIVAMVNA